MGTNSNLHIHWKACILFRCKNIRPTVYPKKYAHRFVVLCFVVAMQSFIMNSHEVFIHIHQGCFAGTGAIVRLPQCQWSKPDGYGKISQCITTTKHSKAKTVCIFLGYTVLNWRAVPTTIVWRRCNCCLRARERYLIISTVARRTIYQFMISNYNCYRHRVLNWTNLHLDYVKYKTVVSSVRLHCKYHRLALHGWSCLFSQSYEAI